MGGMDEKPKSKVEIRQFAGLVTNQDRQDVQAGAARVQINIAASRPDQLDVRKGYRVVRFED
jgi:hypothetical protein